MKKKLDRGEEVGEDTGAEQRSYESYIKPVGEAASSRHNQLINCKMILNLGSIKGRKSTELQSVASTSTQLCPPDAVLGKQP